MIVAAAQTVLEELVELGHRVQRGTGGPGVILGLIRRNAVADFLVHQIDVALVLLDGHLGPDVGRRDQIAGGLIEVERNLLQPRDDVADAVRLGRVFQHEGSEQRIAQRFDV